ncbi:unnamed protein product [Durusdinium trenchii]|uniref:Uncharacterized protein n=2 Tax=Durusdinium trenchii TaxID=1381693 RepID=A0ABP0NI50_9DINO
MAAPGTPPAPESQEFRDLISSKTKAAVLSRLPNVSRHLVFLACKWIMESFAFGGSDLTPSSLSLVLAKSHGYRRRGGSKDTKKWIKEILRTMHEEPGIRSGTHYVGQLTLTQGGKPSVTANKNLPLTKQGAFVLLQRLMPDRDRVDFSNIMWEAMRYMYEAYSALKAEYEDYKADKDQGMAQQRNAADALLNVASATLNVSKRVANIKIMQKAFKEGRRCMLRGQHPKQAMIKANLARRGQRIPAVHNCFTPLGASADAFRTLAMATVLNHARPAIAELHGPRAKKRKMDETFDTVTNHFLRNKTFELPLLSETEQTKAYLESQHQVARRA